jgi:uncharacterized membrane protein YccC
MTLLWLMAGFVFLVHWLMGGHLARLSMFAVMTAAVCYAISQTKLPPSFVPPDIFAGIVISWFISGIPRRVRRSFTANAEAALWAESLERQRLAGREIRNWR